jgi:hypothetical protein
VAAHQATAQAPAAVRDVEEIRRQAREAWLRMRGQENQRSADNGTARGNEREDSQLEPPVRDDVAL